MQNSIRLTILWSVMIGRAEFKSPILNLPEEYIFTKIGSNKLQIVCFGDTNLTWKEETGFTLPGTTITPATNYSVGSMIRIAHYTSQTGMWSCSDETGATAQSYIYFFDHDASIFIWYTHWIYNIYINNSYIPQTITLSCRVTHPDHAVDVYAHGQKLDQTRYEWNPRLGATIDLYEEDPRGEYKCVNNLNVGDELNITVKAADKYIESDSAPEIEIHRNTNFLVGQEMEISCSTKFPGIVHLVYWYTATANRKENIIGTRTNEEGSTVTTLTVLSPTLMDSGLYKCIAMDQDGSSVNQMETEINIEFKESLLQFELEHLSSIYKIGDIVTLTANILSVNPNEAKPIVSWLLNTDCPRGMYSCDPRNNLQLRSSLDRDHIFSNFNWKSVVSFRAVTSGLLHFKVTNQMNSNESWYNIVVSDTGKQFSFNVNNRGVIQEIDLQNRYPIPVFVTDTIILSCTGLQYVYSDITLMVNDTKFRVYKCNTSYSLGECVNVFEVRRNFNSLFTCITQEHDKPSQFRNYSTILFSRGYTQQMISSSTSLIVVSVLASVVFAAIVVILIP